MWAFLALGPDARRGQALDRRPTFTAILADGHVDYHLPVPEQIVADAIRAWRCLRNYQSVATKAIEASSVRQRSALPAVKEGFLRNAVAGERRPFDCSSTRRGGSEK